jgi:MoaD family protein
MKIRVRYWSWFRDLAGLETEEYTLPDGATLGDLLEQVRQQHPKFEEARKSTLTAVGVEYQGPEYHLNEGDEVSLFPPVQGG